MDNRNEHQVEPSAPLEEQRVQTDRDETRVNEHAYQPVILPHFGGFWMRFCSYLFDLLVVGAINGLLVYPVLRFIDGTDSGGMFSVVSIATTIIYFTYFILMTKFFGQTLGKMIFGLKVISLKGVPLSWSTVLFRELIGRYIHTALTIFTIPLLAILYLVVAFTPKKQGIHDLIADTSVIHERTVIAKQKPAVTV